MGEIGNGSGSSYPGNLDTDNNLEVDSPSGSRTLARAAVPNDLAACIVQIESTLGVDPQGTLSDVTTFLQTEHINDGTHDPALVVMLAGAQTIPGNKKVTGSFQGIPFLRGASNLKVNFATTTTLTITADYVYFASPVSPYNGYFAQTNGTTYTNTITTAGPAANGRDQAGAFTASTWVHFYLIVKSSDGTIACVSSATPPIVGPSLTGALAGYDMYYYCHSNYVDGSVHLINSYTRGTKTYYQAQLNALNAGVQTTETSVDLTTLIPPNATEVLLNLKGITTGSPASKTFSVEHVTGSVFHVLELAGSNVATDQISMVITTAQTIYYMISSAAGSTTFSIWVAGFTIPNGAR